ncbi:hypothetical protein P9112_002046 [Eukaryota sp. TZLM1-RC]
MFSSHKATVITGTRRESVLPLNPAQNSANLIAPFLHHNSREFVSRYVEAIKVYAQRMSAHVMLDMTKYPPATHSQSSSTREASRPSPVFEQSATIFAMSKEIEDLSPLRQK